MRVDSKVPLEGDVPSGSGDLPWTSGVNDANKDIGSNVDVTSIAESNLRLRPNVVYQGLPTNHTATMNALSSGGCGAASVAATTTNPSRAILSRKKYICRCPFGNCGREHRSSSTTAPHRNTHRITFSQMNIPLEKEMANPTNDSHFKGNPVPHPASVSGVAQGRTSHQSNGTPHESYATYNTEAVRGKELLARGVYVAPSPTHHPQDLQQRQQQQQRILQQQQQQRILEIQQQQQQRIFQEQQQQQQQQRILIVPAAYRKRAINYMMTHLQLIGAKNDGALQAIRCNIAHIEEQVFQAATDREHYVSLLAIKLSAITERLYSCRRNRVKPVTSVHAPTHPQVPQPTCS